MKILFVNDSKVAGGAELVCQASADFVRDSGHEVDFYYAEKSVSNPFSYLYSFSHASRLKQKIAQFKPDIIHLHNFYHALSPSILGVLKKQRVVMTVHDYHLLCSNNGFVRWKDGQPSTCESCKGKRYHKILLKGCDHRGKVYSALKYFQHFIAYKCLNLEKNIDLFITPSKFMKNKMETMIPADKLKVLYNPVFMPREALLKIKEEAQALTKTYKNIYIGRISPEKGLHQFLSNDYSLERFGELAVIGDGDEDYIRSLPQVKGLSFLGRLSHRECLQYLSRSERLIFPSLCYENCPLTVLEALYFEKEIFHYDLDVVKELQSLDTSRFFADIYTKELLQHYKKLLTEPSLQSL